ncbi:MAG: amino acid adenylation domain-containing protein, partial [Chloroflexi bacterium]|nr:amino acid adenylation domain-containing protein [Chloroflexota bacterium]
KAGGAYLPLDPAYPADRLQYMLSHSRAPVLLTQAALVERLPEHQAEVFRLDADWTRLAAYPETNSARDVLPQHLAYVIYTSGSTGRPKGVMVTQQGVLNLVHGLRVYFNDPAVLNVGLITSISFDISVNQIFPSLIFGRTLHIIPDAVKFNSRALLRYLHEQQIQLLDAVPSYMQAVLNEVAPEQPPNVLRYLLIGGEKIERRLLQAVFRQLGHAVEIVNIYGLTEISDINILGSIRVQDIDLPITVGRPLQNNRIYILNPFDQLQPVGIAGEICIAGESVSRGYLFRPDLAAERFVPCPFEDGQIMVRTGDLGRWRADGTVEILGRIDHQVKLRGYRIELDEISARLRQHPAVHDAVTVIQPGADGTSQLVAYVVENLDWRTQNLGVASDGSKSPGGHPVLGSADLRQHVGAQLPEFMVPSAIVVLDALPLLPNGKLDRKALPAPSTPGSAETRYVAPRTETERRLAAIWADVLKIERIGVEDSFFDLGGHSLLAMQLLVRIQEDLKAELSLRTIFEQPAIAALAPLIDQARAATSSNPSVPLARVSREAYRARRSSVLKDEAGNTR